MNKRIIHTLIIALTAVITLSGCYELAELVHGPKPEPPPVTYTVTYNANGATGMPPETITVNANTIITLPGKGDMASAGNIFVGWTENGVTYPIGASITVNRNMAFSARWIDDSTPQFTVTFHANGATGTPPLPQTVYSGLTIIIPNQGTLTNSSKTFGGWNTDIEGTGINYSADSSYTVTATVTLYARWIGTTITSYTVTFNSNGGSDVATQTVNSGGTATRPANPTLSGYVFVDWYDNPWLTVAYNFSTPVTGNIIVYAKWEPVTYTVAFNSNSGSNVATQTINSGGTATRPANPTRSGYTFVDWYGDSDLTTVYNFNTPVTGNIMLYARWDIVSIPPGSILVSNTIEWENALVNIQNGGSSKEYTIFVLGNVAVPGITADITANTGFGINNNVTVTLQGNGKLYLNSRGSIIRLDNSQTLIIDSTTLTLEGRRIDLNNSAQNNNTTIVYIQNGGMLKLKKGIIANNISITEQGSGVYVGYGSSFNMEGGYINSNTASVSSNNGYGGGVYNNGTFTMSGGEISGNSSGGSSSAYGGGVYNNNNGIFIMSDGKISGNSAYNGGGVYINSGTFTMSGGEINGNNAPNMGSGVFIRFGSFNMEGGTISGNAITYHGGGVATFSNFTKTGGVIYGNDAGVNSNTAQNGSGHAVYWGRSITDGGPLTRNATLYSNNNISTADDSCPPWSEAL